MTTLAKIQQQIKAPKGQFNKFGNYKYRSCEDILEAVKQVINPLGYHITLADEIIEVCGRVYVKATATLSNGTETFTTTAYAREEENKKGMDGSQITGASSSYARKYALNGLFAIDDTKDSDHTNEGDDKVKSPKRDETGNVVKEEIKLPPISDISFKQAQLMAAQDSTIYEKTKRKYSLTARQDELLFEAAKK